MSYNDGTPVATNTLAGALRINDANLSEIENSNLIQPTEFYKVLPFVTASRGTQHSWTVQTSAPGAAFREVGVGVLNAAGQEKTVVATLKVLDASFDRDVALKASLGPKQSWEGYLSRESMKSLNSALSTSEHQLIKGTGGASAGGFDGLDSILDYWGDMGYDVAGSGGTRIYMLALGEDNVAGIFGGDGGIDMSEPYQSKVQTSDGKAYSSSRVDILGSMGLQIAGAYSGAVAYNIDGTTGKTVDFDLISTLYSKFPTAYAGNVNCILMSRKALKQLRDSLVTDLNPSPDFPTEWKGAGRSIKIVVSDAVKDDYEKEVINITGTISKASDKVTAIEPSTAGLKVGMKVTGVSVAAGTTIESIDSATAITLSAATTVGDDGVTEHALVCSN